MGEERIVSFIGRGWFMLAGLAAHSSTQFAGRQKKLHQGCAGAANAFHPVEHEVHSAISRAAAW